MASFNESLSDAVRSTYCAIAGPTALGLGIAGNVYRGLGDEAGGDDLVAAGQIFANASALACNRAPASIGDAISAPFTGGQCDTRYRVVNGGFTWRDAMGNTTVVPGSGTARIGDGPLSLVKDQQNQRWRIESASGGEFLFTADVTAFGDGASIVSINPEISRTDGGPDDCGDPPVEPPDFNPNQWRRTVPVVFDDENGTQITINPDIEFGPATPDGGGLINVPVEITFEDGSSLFGDFNLTTGDINIGLNNSGNEGVQDEGEELEEGEEEDRENYAVVGAHVIVSAVTGPSEARRIDQSGGNPDIYAPRIGSLAFLYEMPGGGQAWGTDIDIKGTDFVIWAERPAITAKATPYPGTVFSVRLLSERVCVDECQQ